MIEKFMHRLVDKILPPFAVALSFVAFAYVASAAMTQTPINLAPADQARLRAQLTATDTGATLEPLKKWVNGVRTTGCFDSPSAFILIEDDNGRREWASYTSKSCDSDKVTTLSGLTRGLSPTTPSFVGGTGLAFDAGATVSVNDYPLTQNYALYKDRFTSMSGSGGIKCTGTQQGCIAVGAFTTAQRDAFTHNSGSTIIHNTTLDAIQYYNGSSWLSLAVSTGSFINATESVGGKVQLGTLANQSGMTILGSAGVPTVVQTKLLTGTGGRAWRIPFTGRSGTLTGSLLGTGTADSSTFLRGDGVWGTTSDTSVYGSGEDGTVTLTGSIILRRDMYYDTLRLNGYTININGYKIFVKNTLSGSGTIRAYSGGNASTTTGGAGATGSTLPAAPSGGNGGAAQTVNATPGIAGSVGTNSTNSLTGTGSLRGGAGGQATSGPRAGGAGGTGGTLSFRGKIGDITTATSFARWVSGTFTQISAIPGSGGGGSGGRATGLSGYGGGGGGGGGYWFIAARVVSGNFTVRSLGGNGANGDNGQSESGGGGGGSGGPGGSGVFIYNIRTGWTGSFILTGGTAGTGGTGSSGDSGSNGTAGRDGVAVQIQF